MQFIERCLSSGTAIEKEWITIKNRFTSAIERVELNEALGIYKKIIRFGLNLIEIETEILIQTQNSQRMSLKTKTFLENQSSDPNFQKNRKNLDLV